jgi:CRP/FNR family transcriptional regulator
MLPSSSPASDTDARKLAILRCWPHIGIAHDSPTMFALLRHASLRSFEKRAVLAAQDQPAEHLLLIGAGRVVVTHTTMRSDLLTLGFRGAGDFVGEGLFGGQSTYGYTATAIEGVDALALPAHVVRDVVLAHPALSASIVRVLLDRQADDHARVAALHHRPVRARIARVIDGLATRWGIPCPSGTTIGMPITHETLAALAGTTRETATVEMSALRKLGEITIDRRRITITNRSALRARI